jgi:hypothetical protein
MTKNDLDTWRKRIPWVLFALIFSPFILGNSGSETDFKRNVEYTIPALAFAATFFYVGADVRRWLWKREIDAHVGEQIRNALLKLVPDDLEMTEAEKKELLDREIFRELTGVFWEAVDRDEVLRSHKEHFYSNGIVYSTSIDVVIIFALATIGYGVLYFVTRDIRWGIWGTVAILTALASGLFVTPSRRRRHLVLSTEQLDLLSRNQFQFVSERFREIIINWRKQRIFA